ncbi:hypothetical protein GCM10011576_41850 [Micromonospora parathelypteridis]|nr:hypothetical protein GCM10011576_41850 [Micromonospora parathelypteridis]
MVRFRSTMPGGGTTGMSLEQIADLCGHSGTTVTESVYRHQLRPVLLGGAVAMDRTFDAEA